jgi:diguanylate cyclase (GGDEF)-like protein
MGLFSDYKYKNKRVDDPSVVYKQLTVHAEGYRAASFGNLFNAAISAYVFHGMIPLFVATSVFLWIFILIAWRYTIVDSIKKLSLSSPNMMQIASSLNRNAFVLGASWGGVAGWLMATSTGAYQLYAAILAAGMMGSGAIAYRTREKAAMLYVLGCAPGGAVALVGMGSAPAYAALGLLVAYLAVLIVNIRNQARAFVLDTKRANELAKSRATVKLLLNDYEEHSADWLIELDEDLCIINPSARLARASQRPIETLSKKPFTSLFTDDEGLTELTSHLTSRRPVRRTIVSLSIDGKQFWWSISARPVEDDVIAYRGVITDITAQRAAEEKVNFMAHFDGLTSLPNRFVFAEKLEDSLEQQDGNVGLLCLDLDQFKGVNDTLGHQVGDKLLRKVAARLSPLLHRDEILARLGGDEFSIIVPHSRLQTMDDLANAIIMAVKEPFKIDGHDVQVGVSIGLCAGPEHGRTMERLCRSGDLALYAAKANGRNCAVWFNSELDIAAQQRREIELDMRIAINEGQFKLLYQPLVDVNTGEPNGYEALVRWVHPVKGVVMPTTFIPVAEENGMIIQIGEWVIRQAISDLKKWPEHISISVNLSPSQMRSPSLLTTVINAIARDNVDATRLCFEITESVLLHDSESNLETLMRLKNLGIKIALDDFGTGYSSLNYLRSFPFDKIKIDRCFVDEIDVRADCRAIVRSVIELSSSLGMEVTAEGVERQEQADVLKANGCNEVQGYLFSKAVSIEELTNLRGPSRSAAFNNIAKLDEIILRQHPIDEMSRKTGTD